jgi:hypothetical protein
MNDEFEGCGRKCSWSISGTVTAFTRRNWENHWDSNQASPKYESQMLPFVITCVLYSNRDKSFECEKLKYFAALSIMLHVFADQAFSCSYQPHNPPPSLLETHRAYWPITSFSSPADLLLLLQLYFILGGTRCRSRLRHCATSRKVIGVFNWPNPSSRTMAFGLTQPLTEMSTRNLPG